ncbi:MAG: hypothetical protein HY784_02475 [Chloroflexi bacterium]|nr:hypothetical protein [Chloroflexota bacterium]
MSTLNKPISRGSCVLAALALLLIFGLTTLALALAARGEVLWQRGSASDRLFLINEQEAQGLGLESVRPYRGPGGAACTRTSDRFFLWRGSGENATYCECQTAGGPQIGSCP